MRVPLALLIASLAGSSADAQAAPAPLAIGGVEVTGATSDAVQVAMVDAVRAGLGQPNPGPTAPVVASCITPTCLADAARAAQADRAVAVAVAISGDFRDQFAFTVIVTDGEGRVLRRRSSECATCAVDEATEKITALVGETAGAVTDDVVAVEIATTPIAADLTVDGVARGRAPWSGSLPAGPHNAIAGTVSHEFFLEATGAAQRIEIALPVTAGHRRRFGLITYGTAAVGAGALFLGVAMIVKDGDPTCAHPSCPEVYDTGTVGWVSAGIGAVALGAAGYMFWSDRRADRPVLAVVPTTGGAAAVATGRF